MQKCPTCKSRILAGGENFFQWRFCSELCAAKFKCGLVDELVPSEVIDERVNEIFEAPCPKCGREGYNDLWSATTVTGMLLMYTINSQSNISCSGCARSSRLLAALHCLFLGWWSPRALLFNMFVLPTNLIALCLVKDPIEPSEELKQVVKSKMAEALASQISASRVAAAASPMADSDG